MYIFVQLTADLVPKITDFGISMWQDVEVSSDFLEMHYRGKDIYSVGEESKNNNGNQSPVEKEQMKLRYKEALDVR